METQLPAGVSNLFSGASAANSVDYMQAHVGEVHSMDDAIASVFTHEIVERLRKRQAPSWLLLNRIHVVTADVVKGDDEAARRNSRNWLAQRLAWNDYLAAVIATGLLTNDLRSRLTGTNEDNFRSALSECMMCWLLTQRLGLSVSGAQGRPGKAPDFGVLSPDGPVSVEVKSPFVELPESKVWFGSEHQILEPSIDAANKQFSEENRNVLAIVPLVQFPMLSRRETFVTALLGEFKIALTINTRGGGVVGPPRTEFVPDGKLMKPWGNEPRFKRVGAVVVLRETFSGFGFDDEPDIEVRRKWFAIHNPYATKPIPAEMWGDCPQLVVDGDAMRWTDEADTA